MAKPRSPGSRVTSDPDRRPGPGRGQDSDRGVPVNSGTDPQRPGHLLLQWSAKDTNLTPTPITLEWCERQGGPLIDSFFFLTQTPPAFMDSRIWVKKSVPLVR